ncbi:hypothetical protein ACO2Q8_07860 [Larkinella sp. VNQ87]|uniref:hypothetical protein n=1 Tax=Larkinella sp. VNQ87 TaxID=3400921 RepID=UPI003C078177
MSLEITPRPGRDGRPPEFRSNGGVLQWRYVGQTDAQWVPLPGIGGPGGGDLVIVSETSTTVTLGLSSGVQVVENNDNTVTLTF